MNTYFFECYTKHPETKETGWDISVGTIYNVREKSDAVAKLHRHFGDVLDVVIQCHQIAPPYSFGKNDDPLSLDTFLL